MKIVTPISSGLFVFAVLIIAGIVLQSHKSSAPDVVQAESTVVPTVAESEETFVFVEPQPPLPQLAEPIAVFSDTATASDLSAIVAFKDWRKTYLSSSSKDRASLLAEGIELAKKRRPIMLGLIQSDPRAALASAVSRAERLELPEVITRHLEVPLSARAELAVMQSCLHPNGTNPEHVHDVYRTTVIDDREYRAHVYGSRLQDASLPETSLSGFALDGHMAVLDERIRIVEEGERVSTGGAPYGGDGIVVEANGEHHVLESMDAVIEFAQSLRDAEMNPVFSEADSGSGSSGVSGRPAQSWTHGDKSLLVIRVDFSDVPGAPINKFDGNAEITPVYINTVINGSGEVRSFLQDNSFGKTDIIFNSATDVTAVLRMPNTASSYATADAHTLLHTHARAAALTAGFDATNYDRVAVVFTFLGDLADSEFTFGGLANVTGSNIWINGAFDFRVVGHELGHTYGLRHSNLWQVPGSDPVDLAGSSVEYGDVFDLMGDGDFVENEFSHWNKSLLQWIPDTSVETISSGSTVRVHRLDASGADLGLMRAAKVVRDSTRDYWIGYRRALSSTATDNGAYVLWGYNSAGRGNLLDLTTPGANEFDAPLALGATFNDSAAGIELSTVGQGGSGANEWIDVAVSFQPRLSWSSSNYVVNEQGGFAELTVTRESNFSGAVSVNYNTTGGTASSGTDFSTSSGTLNWASGDMTSKTISIPLVADALVEGTETFSVSLTSPVGGVVVEPFDATVTIADPGASDPAFFANFINNSVHSVRLLPDGKILIGGDFSQLQDTEFKLYAYGRIARLNEDGTIDTDFDPGAGANSTVRSIAVLPDGKILIAGSFTSVGGISRNRIARLNSDGSLDLSFDPGDGANGTIYEIIALPNGKILLGGSFTTFDSTSREYLARLDADGDLDTTFTGPDFGSTSGWRVESLALQSDGKLLVGGSFFFSGTSLRRCICRLDSNGALDLTFNGVTNGAHLLGNTSQLRTIERIEVQPDSQILIAGSFTAFNNTARGGIARLTNTGALDSGFNPSANGSVFALLLLPDESILIGGDFTQVGSTSAARIASIESTGAVNGPFSAAGGHASTVLDFALQPDGNVLLGGNFASFQGSASGRPLWRFVPGLSGTPGVLQFASDSTTVPEGETAALSVTRIGGSLGSLTVGYATVDGTAVSGSDFTDTTGTLTWSDGDTTAKTINLPAMSDAIVDTPEALTVNLGAPQIGAVLLGDRQQMAVTIETAFNLWKEGYFNAAELLDPLTSGDSADPDGDGYENLAEFAFDSNPRVVDGGSLPAAGVQEISGSEYVTITFKRRLPALDLVYTVQSDSELDGAWGGSPVQVGSGVDNMDGTETVTYRDTIAVGPTAPKRFLRVTVTRTP